MSSQLQFNGGTASPQTPLTFETEIEQCNDQWAVDYRSRWDRFPIQDLILEILARSCYYAQQNMNPTIKINFLEEKDDITLKTSWTDKGWNRHDYRRFYRLINDNNREKTDSMSQKHKGFRVALSSLIKEGTIANMIIYINEDIKYKGQSKGIPYYDDIPKGWYNISIDGSHKWHKMRWEKINIDTDEPIKTHLTIKLKDERVKELKRKNGIDTVESHLMSCFNKMKDKVTIILNGRELDIKPLIPNKLPVNNSGPELRIITIKGIKYTGSIESKYVEKTKHNTSNFLKITCIETQNPNMIRNIEIFNEMKASGENFYYNMQPAELHKLRARKGIYKGQRSGFALDYHFIPEKYFRRIDEVIMVDDREEPSVEIGPAVISLKFAVSYYKNYMGIHSHLDRPNGVKGGLGAGSPAGISLYSKDVMICTNSKRWSSGLVTSLDNNRWRPRTMIGKTKNIKEDKFVKCIPICEINQNIDMWNKESLYNCNSSLKNSSKLKQDNSKIFTALTEYMWHTHLYELTPTWPQSKHCKANVSARDELALIDQWNTNEEINRLEKLKKAEKARVEAEKARVEAEKARVKAEKARVEAEKAKAEAEKAKKEAEEKANRLASENKDLEKKSKDAEVQIKEAKKEAEEAKEMAQTADDRIKEAETEAEIKDNELQKVKAELNFNKGDTGPKSIKITMSAIYFFTDPTRPRWFKVGWTKDTFEKLKKQSRYGPNQFPMGLNWHSYKEINTFNMNEKLAERLLHNRYHNLRINKTEWFTIPENYEVTTFIDDTKGFLEKVQESLTPI